MPTQPIVVRIVVRMTRYTLRRKEKEKRRSSFHTQPPQPPTTPGADFCVLLEHRHTRKSPLGKPEQGTNKGRGGQ